MRTAALLLALLIASVVLAWVLTLGTCGVLWISDTRAVDFVCGHNAAILLLPYWIASLVVLPVLWSRLRGPRQSGVSSPPKCSNCGNETTFDAAVCANCGFRFSSGSPT